MEGHTVKSCSNCYEEYPLDEFSHAVINGRVYKRSMCKDCSNLKNREATRAKAEIKRIKQLLKEVGTPPCEGCELTKICATSPKVMCQAFKLYVEGIAA